MAKAENYFRPLYSIRIRVKTILIVIADAFLTSAMNHRSVGDECCSLSFG
jgi:hypothetical protein